MSHMFRYKYTIFRENTMPVLKQIAHDNYYLQDSSVCSSSVDEVDYVYT